MTGPNGLIANRYTFTGNSLSAGWYIGRNAELPYAPSSGRLDNAESRAYMLACDLAERSNRRLYVVRSYSTPVAWAIESEPAHIVNQKFSVTTSKGQNYVRAWINHRYQWINHRYQSLRDAASQCPCPTCQSGVGPCTDVNPGWRAYQAERKRLAI